MHFDFERDFYRIAQELSEEALQLYGNEGDDISINDPVKENLIVLLTGVTLKLNVLICGKPGTSKTLAVQIIQKILHPDRNLERVDSKYMKYFKSSQFEWIFGSTSTTSKMVQRKMDNTQSLYLELQKDLSQVVTLIFDEIGLAEMSLDNPLKVLHSYLDPGSEDKSEELKELLLKKINQNEKYSLISNQEKNQCIDFVLNNKIAFVGISNWKLDASKSSRMIFIARGNLNENQLEISG
jgi:hypothetical protein